MQTLTRRPETERGSPAGQAAASTPPSSSINADLALIGAILAPMAIMGLLVVTGVGIAAAVCIMFASVYAVTTTLDVGWVVRRRRASNESAERSRDLGSLDRWPRADGLHTSPASAAAYARGRRSAADVVTRRCIDAA